MDVCDDGLVADIGFAELLALPGVEEHCELRSTFGFMAYHGGALEEATDVDRPRRGRAGGRVVLRRAPARRDATPHPVDEDPPAGIRGAGAIRRPCRRRRDDPRVRPARLLHGAAARRTQPPARRPCRRPPPPEAARLRHRHRRRTDPARPARHARRQPGQPPAVRRRADRAPAAGTGFEPAVVGLGGRAGAAHRGADRRSRRRRDRLARARRRAASGRPGASGPITR